MKGQLVDWKALVHTPWPDTGLFIRGQGYIPSEPVVRLQAGVVDFSLAPGIKYKDSTEPEQAFQSFLKSIYPGE